ncbi:glutamine--fructose-6-phosphate transaminase (isomerizing) [Natronorarus salvus]|uniref:glutamine--fructose-6-phosphate transaminase (isomerizing) n=1 Tax=Natronorarus salvus TaxID=3117733 RepID=UPI002F26C383
MCGIIARVGEGATTEELLDGLRNLEYRGYDSAGLAVGGDGRLDVVKAEGAVERLVEATSGTRREGVVGIGHTRWSTHGPPSDANAHPHTDCRGEVAVVHNGIIENYDSLRSELRERDHRFTSETDTEVLPHLIEEGLAAGEPIEAAFRSAVSRLRGSYAVAMIARGHDAVFAARQGSPLVLGVGDGVTYLASDVPAFLEFTDRVVFLDDGTVAVVTESGYRLTDSEGAPLEAERRRVTWRPEDVKKDGFAHYMLKEIHEQPTALRQALSSQRALRADGGPCASDVENVQLVACGTSFHASLYGAYLLNARGIPAQALLASEYPVRLPPVTENTLVIAVTQSGETADTLTAIESARAAGARTLAVTNVVGSSAARVCDDTVFIRAGPEIGVAATKTFSSQILALLSIVEGLADEPGERSSYTEAIEALPEQVQWILDTSTSRRIAERYRTGDRFLFIGRGLGYPVALEGALKMKEISYEHAEGFAAGELKHGPLALVTPSTVVFAVFTGRQDEKLLNNVEEARTRGASVVAVAAPSDGRIEGRVDDVLVIPRTHPDLAGLLANVQLQLVSYHAADLLGRPIDKPRNLAKSVTVE